MNESRLSINARSLRKRQPRAEELLWRKLRARQLEDAKCRRQVPIGNYIVDFFSFEKKIVIELDGGQHAETIASDAVRDSWLRGRGYKVLRFWDNEVFQNIEGILRAKGVVPLTSYPLPPGERKPARYLPSRTEGFPWTN